MAFKNFPSPSSESNIYFITSKRKGFLSPTVKSQTSFNVLQLVHI